MSIWQPVTITILLQSLYTDCGIFTCDERFGEDATAVFNMLSGYSEPKNWNRSDRGTNLDEGSFPEADRERGRAREEGNAGYAS